MGGNAHQEYILDDDECPLAILMNHPSARGKNYLLYRYVLDKGCGPVEFLFKSRTTGP